MSTSVLNRRNASVNMSTSVLNRRNASVNMLLTSEPIIPAMPPSPSPLKPVNTSSLSPATTPTSATHNNTTSLFHTCRSVLDQLSDIEGMSSFLEKEKDSASSHPLNKLASICQLGDPFFILYNALNPAKKLVGNLDPKLSTRNACKASVYHFIVACRKELIFSEDDLFSISDLFSEDEKGNVDTNGFVKVVNTINKLLQLLEDRGIITVRQSNRNSDTTDPHAPKNTRDKVVLELLETERSYVRDMETLQSYMRELQNQRIVSPDTIHYLFGNLNALVDFQRRFLIQLEEIAEKPAEEQRIGNLFIQMEESFSVYEPYCANYYSAQDLVVQETPRLQKLSDTMDPSYQLPSMLIKPIQRLCKYPLLLRELEKYTAKEWPYYDETVISVEAAKRITEKVNETQRQRENVEAFQELKKRLDDWKELTLDGYGSLLLKDKLCMAPNMSDNERELHVFFFEKALLFCKESKGNNILQNNTLSINKKKRRGSLVPKLILQTFQLKELSNTVKNNGSLYLTIDLTDSEFDQISIKFSNEEKLKLWTTTLTKAITKAVEIESDLLAMQLSTPYSIEDEEDLDDELYDEEEDDYVSNTSRSRSSSTSMARYKLTQSESTPTMTTAAAAAVSKYTSAGRPFHNVPGMNLSPLPRSNSSLTTNTLFSSSPPTMNSHYYPASPPSSLPSSPTSSSRGNNWQQQPSNGLVDMATTLQNDDQSLHYAQHALLAAGRSQSHSTAMDRNYQSANTNTRPTLTTLTQNRVRSQSSPNIMKNSSSHLGSVMMELSSSTSTAASTSPPTPQLPPMRTSKPAPLDLSRSEGQHQHYIRANVPTTPLTPNSTSAPLTPGAIKIKLNFNDGIYVIVTNHEVTFYELMEKVDKKIRLVANLKLTDLLRLKYQDEDSDFITINSNDDVQMAFESRGVHNTVNLFVSV